MHCPCWAWTARSPEVGTTVAGKEHIAVKSGATITDGQMVAMNMAGYIDAKKREEALLCALRQ